MKIYTIGHSTHAITRFIAMLKSFDIQLLADIRSMPGSKKYPQFNQDALSWSLKENGIEYVHMPGLGGRRRALKHSVNTVWQNKAFRGYADYMGTDEFKTAIQELERLATIRCTAYMCAEAVWWRCHRSLVSDYLKAHGWEVLHIMDIGKVTEHPYSSPARPVQGDIFHGSGPNK